MKAFRRVAALVIITRPHNCLIAAASVLVGGFLAASGFPESLLPATLMAFFACAGAYVLNDIFDVRTDRITKPGRPLAAGRLSRDQAVKHTVVLWAVGVGFGLLGGWEVLLFFGTWAVLLWLYSWKLKAQGLPGNLVISAVASSGLILGAVVAGDGKAGLPPFLIALVLHLAREIAKGVADAKGDRVGGISTLAVGLGELRTLGIVLWLLVCILVVGVAPFGIRIYGYLYLVTVVLGVYPLVGVSIYAVVEARAGRRGMEEAARLVSSLLKVAMPVGLVAFLLAGI